LDQKKERRRTEIKVLRLIKNEIYGERIRGKK